MLTLDPILILLANYCIACLFLSACFGKVRGFGVFRATLEDYELVPSILVSSCAIAVIAVEAVIGVGALIPGFAPLSMAAAVALLMVYVLAIGINLARGRTDIDCGCTGPAVRQLISKWLLLRNLGLAGIALVGMATPSQRPPHMADLVLTGVALLGAMALYGAINQLMANAPRLDALDSLMDAN